MLVVGIVLFDNVEVLDYCGPFEVFTSANYVRGVPTVSVYLVANKEMITTVGGMRVLPDITKYKDCPPLDVMLVPGGVGSRWMAKDPESVSFVRERSSSAKIIASVCTGSLVLGAAGLLKGKRATTHWELFQLMEEENPDCTVDRTKHWVADGNVWTSAGISAGIDMSIRLVEFCLDEETARQIAKYMEYQYPEKNERRI